MKYFYYREDYGEGPDVCYELDLTHKGLSTLDVAECAAEDFFNAHNGWESDWPMTFVILNEEKREIGRQQVDVEHRPNFYGVVT